jgi:putative phosphoesterase
VHDSAAMANQPRIVVGVISDTHGLLRPEALAALHGSGLIIHAGDVGDPEILDRLREIAPTFAVRGNVDTSPWAQRLPLTDVVEAGSVQCYVLHNLLDLGLDPKAAGFAVVISGHTHRPHAQVRHDVLYLNPGSAGPRRFTLPIAVARIEVNGSHISHEIIELQV